MKASMRRRPFSLADGRHGPRLRRVHREGLLAEHVLARLERRDGPLGVEVVGQGNIDGLDLGIGDELGVGAVAPGYAESRGGLFGPGRAAARDRDDARLVRRERGWCMRSA
jgi:hypothetical protein